MFCKTCEAQLNERIRLSMIRMIQKWEGLSFGQNVSTLSEHNANTSDSLVFAGIANTEHDYEIISHKHLLGVNKINRTS